MPLSEHHRTPLFHQVHSGNPIQAGETKQDRQESLIRLFGDSGHSPFPQLNPAVGLNLKLKAATRLPRARRGKAVTPSGPPPECHQLNFEDLQQNQKPGSFFGAQEGIHGPASKQVLPFQ